MRNVLSTAQDNPVYIKTFYIKIAKVFKIKLLRQFLFGMTHFNIIFNITKLL
jgi:hypothetical protein